jgi:hypothetical protein
MFYALSKRHSPFGGWALASSGGHSPKPRPLGGDFYFHEFWKHLVLEQRAYRSVQVCRLVIGRNTLGGCLRLRWPYLYLD